MDKIDLPVEPQPEEGSFGRRKFLLRAGAFGLSVVALETLLAACTNPSSAPLASPLATVTPTVLPTATPTLMPTATPFPTATPTPRPTPTPTPFPTATPTPRPTATPTPTPIPPTIIESESIRIGHLLRRAGFGATKADYDKFNAMGFDAAVDYLVDYEKIDDSKLESDLASQEFDFKKSGHIKRWWIQRMAYTERPLQEKMVLFWHGILTSSYRKGRPLWMHAQNELFRKHAMGNYDVLLKAIGRDPAMLYWLDSQSNKKKAPNENYSRELMELFAMGLGVFTEEDVRESARAFTGWGVKRKKGDQDYIEFKFNPDQHDTGDKRFLGEVGNFDGDDVVDIILKQPVSAEFIATELFRFFAYDNPEPEVIRPIAATFRESNYSIKAAMRALLKSAAFSSEKAYRAKIKSPTEFVVGAVRSLDIATDKYLGMNVLSGVLGPMEQMGQALLNPPDVSGWDGGETWINSSTLLERLNFINTLSSGRNRSLPFDSEKLLGPLADNNETSLAYFNEILLDGAMNLEDRQIIAAYLSGVDKQSGANGRVEKLNSLVYLMMSSPEYHLA